MDVEKVSWYQAGCTGSSGVPVPTHHDAQSRRRGPCGVLAEGRCCSILSSTPVVPFSCLPRPSPTMSSLQTTTKAKSPTGSPSLACPSLWDLPLSLHAPPPHSSANKCLLKVAGYAAQLEQYQKAIDIYEQVGFAWLSASATTPSARPTQSPLSQATLTKCSSPAACACHHLVLDGSCHCSQELPPELGVLSRKIGAEGEDLAEQGFCSMGNSRCHMPLGHCLWGRPGCGLKKGRQLALGEGCAQLFILPQLPPLCPLSASFLYG